MEKMTVGQVIRALNEFYPSVYDMNMAVNAYRRERGSKNWAAAAMALLAELSITQEI